MTVERQKDQKVSDYIYRVNIREDAGIVSKFLRYDGFCFALDTQARASMFSRDNESQVADLARHRKVARKLAGKAFVSIKPIPLQLNDESEANYSRAIRIQLRWFLEEPIASGSPMVLWETVLNPSVRRVSMADIYKLLPPEYTKARLKELYAHGYKVCAEPIQVQEAKPRINKVPISHKFDSIIPWENMPEFDHKMEHYYRDQGKLWPPQIVVSLSGGKDSTAVLLKLLEDNIPIHSVYAFDTGWEFPEMYDHLDKLERYTGFKITRMRSPHNFDDLLKKYRWPSKGRRWCTSEKIAAGKRYIKSLDPRYVYLDTIGFAADEEARTMTAAVYDRWTLFPMVDYWRMDEKDALDLCKQHGFDWGGLYEHFDRVSCFCCPLSKKREMWALRQHYPALWKRMEKMEEAIPVGKYAPHFKGGMGIKAYGEWLDHQYSMLTFMGGGCQAGACTTMAA